MLEIRPPSAVSVSWRESGSMASSLDGRSSAVDPVPPVPACCGRPVISTRLQRFRSGGGTVYHVVVASRPKQVWQARVLGSKKGSDKPRSPLEDGFAKPPFSRSRPTRGVWLVQLRPREEAPRVPLACCVVEEVLDPVPDKDKARFKLRPASSRRCRLGSRSSWNLAVGVDEPAGRDVASDSQCISVNRATGAILIFNSAWLCPYMSPWKKLENRMATRCGV